VFLSYLTPHRIPISGSAIAGLTTTIEDDNLDKSIFTQQNESISSPSLLDFGTQLLMVC
jgi:hypothetical protein